MNGCTETMQILPLFVTAFMRLRTIVISRVASEQR
jgi:hypothetical protein